MFFFLQNYIYIFLIVYIFLRLYVHYVLYIVKKYQYHIKGKAVGNQLNRKDAVFLSVGTNGPVSYLNVTMIIRTEFKSIFHRHSSEHNY